MKVTDRIDIEQFKKDYPWMTNRELMKKYSIGKSSCMKLGRQFSLNKKHGLTGQFKKGSESWNKGKKVKVTKNMSRTMFKKGHTPSNHKPIGTISTRKNKKGPNYMWIKTGEGKWEMLHRVIWSQHHPESELKSTDLIKFKDGDSMNCRIENLFLEDYKGNMKANSSANLSDGYIVSLLAGRKATPEAKAIISKHQELIQLKRNQLLISRKINKHEH